ncbi:hypothetical protein N7524_011300 [Penicillium chrysogenum]|nr:hypothetical protein N7524_011300 [Penicillium chrysogenum]
MAPPIPFAFRIQPNLDPAEALSSDDSHVWIAELPAEGLRVTGALPVRLIRTGCRIFTQSFEAFSAHTDKAGAYMTRMEVAGGGATLLATFNHLATAVRRCAPFLGSWEVVYNEDESAQAFAVSLFFGQDAVFHFSTTMAMGWTTQCVSALPTCVQSKGSRWPSLTSNCPRWTPLPSLRA